MIKPKAIVVTDWDATARKNKPVMVLTITEESISAAAESGTNNAAYVEQVVKRYNNSDSKGKQGIYDDLLESFERMPHGHGYGGTTEIVEYVGPEKTRVDKIKDKLVALKVEKELS